MSELKSELNWFFIVAIASIIWIFSFIIILIIQPFSAVDYWLCSSIYFFSTAIFGSIGVAFAMKSFTLKTTNGKIMGFLTIGMIFIVIAELFYLVYVNILLLEIYPSPADIFWSIGYSVATITFIWQAKVIEVEINKKHLVLFLAVIGALAVFIIFLEIIPIILEPISADFPLEQKFLGLWYPIVILLVSIFAGLVILKYIGGKISYAWIFICCGFICQFIAVTWFAVIAIDNSYDVYHPVDIFWIIGYLLVGLGGLYQVYLLKQAV